ncbi:MAG: hypothetical protein ACLPYZ_13235 [Limisphaerales bacterium]
MTTELSNFAARLRELISNRQSAIDDRQFSALALELFTLQFKHNAAYRKICAARGLTPEVVEHWTQIPAVPTSAFKELELTCLAPNERTAVFHSSGTVEQKPGRHFHNAESLAVYEASLWSGFQVNVAMGAPNSDSACFPSGIVRADSEIGAPSARQFQLIILTPPPPQAPHSSLVHMFETVRQKLGGAGVPALSSRRSRRGGEGGSRAEFLGSIAADGSWALDFAAAADLLSPRRSRNAGPDAGPLLLLGTAFSFVHLLDFLADRNLHFDLPAGSRGMETGGYKNRSRSMPKTELHQLITERLGIPSSHIICEYGMSELSSQAYDPGALASRRRVSSLCSEQVVGVTPALPRPDTRHFHFPAWARVRIISPETGREVADGETGLIRVFDLANVFSVMAIQTEDLGIHHGQGFELIGRAALAEPRGCSLMAAETRKS